MMNSLAEALLEEYTAADATLGRFITAYQAVIKEYTRLDTERGMAEAKVKEAVRQTLTPLENEVFAVTVLAKTRKWYDADKVLELAPYVAQMPGVMEVNRERINQLAKAKALPEDVVTAAYREEAMTPAVTIKRKA